MVLPASVRSVSDLLRHLGEAIDFVFLDAVTGKLRPDIEVIVNGKEIWFYAERASKDSFTMGTRLKSP